MSRSKRLTQNVMFYTLGMFATKLIQFLFVPLYTIYISSEQFGYFDFVTSIIVLFIPLAYQSLSEAILRFTIDQEKIKNSFERIISTVLIYSFILTIIYLLISFVLFESFVINNWGFIIFMAIGQMLVSVWQFTSRALKLNRIYTLAVVVSATINILVNIILIVGFSYKIEALFLANIASSFSMVLVIESKAKILKSVQIKYWDLALLKKMLVYSSPLAVNASSWWLLNFANRIIIINSLGLMQNGIYAMSARIVTVVNLFTTVFNMAWQEEAFREYESKDRDQYFNKALDFFTRFVTSCLMLLLPITYLIYPYIVYGDYSDGKNLMPILYLSAIIAPLASHLGSAFTARKETKPLLTTTLVPGLISVVISLSLINYIGLFSVAIGSLIGYICMFIMRVYLLNKRMDLVINYNYLMVFSLLYVFFSFVFFKLGFIANCLALFINSILFFIINKELIGGIVKKLIIRIKKGG